MNKLKPFYKQIADALEQDINNNKFRPGSRMPTEKQIQERFFVSRMTVRQAFKLLESRGVAAVIKNKGLFVRDAHIQRESTSFSYKQMIESSGQDSETKVMEFKKIIPSKEVREKLQLEENEEVYRLQRHRYIKGELVCIETANIPVKLATKLDKHDFAKESLYEVLENQYKLKVGSIKEVLTADLIVGNEARLMLGSKSGPAFRIKTTVYDDNATPIEYNDTICNYKVYSYITYIKTNDSSESNSYQENI